MQNLNKNYTMKRLFFLSCLLVCGLASVAQRQYVNIIATGKQAREGISLSGAIPAGMQDFYTSYYGNIVTLGDVINQLAEHGFVVDQMTSDCYAPSGGEASFREIVIMSRLAVTPEDGSIEATIAHDPNATEVARYNLQGQPVDKDEKGVQIVVYSDLSARTVVVP